MENHHATGTAEARRASGQFIRDDDMVAAQQPMARAQNGGGDHAPPLSPLAQSVVVWGMVSLVLALCVLWGNTAPAVLRAGFFMKALAVLVATGLGTTGAVIGDALRKFTRPDAFYTSGGMGRILWLKLFWMCGPQLIGLGIGLTLGLGLVLH